MTILETIADLLTDLLLKLKMSGALKFNLDKVSLKKVVPPAPPQPAMPPVVLPGHPPEDR